MIAATVCVLLALSCSSSTPGPPTAESAADSVVRIIGFGCGAPTLGSGFAVSENLVITNGHLVTGRDPTSLAVARPDGTEAPATLVGFDPDLDLAALRVDGLGLDPVALAPEVPTTNGLAMTVRADDTIEPIDFVVDAPIIVNWDGVFRDTESRFEGIRLDAETARGDSGAGLFVSENEVIGLLHSTTRRGEPRAYAVSAPQISSWLENIDPDVEVVADRCP